MRALVRCGTQEINIPSNPIYHTLHHTSTCKTPLRILNWVVSLHKHTHSISVSSARLLISVIMIRHARSITVFTKTRPIISSFFRSLHEADGSAVPFSPNSNNPMSSWNIPFTSPTPLEKNSVNLYGFVNLW